ncbi:MAG: EndoU domain-containing protein, partial [Firmicutes bacterium]|nr:EndoU domain-containing protein [Bacillota bacterium]
FSSSAIEHIFLGTVNSNKKGSGYHYDMIEGSPGQIVEGTRSKTDKNGCYTANVTVNGYVKEHYSTFYPDEWTPQQVVDAIVAARKDALDNDRHKGSTYIGYYNGIEIDMYLDSKDRVVSAYPIYSKK